MGEGEGTGDIGLLCCDHAVADFERQVPPKDPEESHCVNIQEKLANIITGHC